MDALLTKQADELANELTGSDATLDDLNGMMRSLMKTAIETMLSSEMSVHLGRGRAAVDAEAERGEKALCETTSEGVETSAESSTAKPRNRRNASSPKTIQGESDQLPIAVPRDREGTFEPQLLGKYQRRLPGFDEKILALDAKGMTTRDIQDLVKELYGVEISPTLVSEITEDLDGEVKAWQTRRLEAIWPVVFMDGIVVHNRGESGRVSEHSMSVAIGVDWEGRKELLGPWFNETEGAKFWLSCLTDLKNRGVTDMSIVCVDGLSGFPEAMRDPRGTSSIGDLTGSFRLGNSASDCVEFNPSDRVRQTLWHAGTEEQQTDVLAAKHPSPMRLILAFPPSIKFFLASASIFATASLAAMTVH